MIEFKRVGTKFVVNINSGIKVDRPVYGMQWECSDEAYAQMLVDQMQSTFNKIIEDIRREEYNQGWRDKTKRFIRREHFHIAFRKIWG